MSVVQSIENWAEVEGDVAGLEPAGEAGLDGFVGVRLVGVTVRDIAGYPNLVGDPAATGPDPASITVLVPTSSLPSGLAGGSRVLARVRRARPGRMFAHPGHFEVL